MSCPDCFRGHIHDGKAKGRETKMYGFDTYVASPEPENPKGIVVMLPDILGWKFINARLVADNYAKKSNYKVIMPDFMNGRAAPLSILDTITRLFATSTVWDWVSKPYHIFRAMYAMIPFFMVNSIGKSWPRVKTFFSALRKDEGAALPVGVAGFCWGGKHVMLLTRAENFVDDRALVDAGFTAHPSMVKLPVDIEKIIKPVSFAIGDLDVQLKQPQHDIIREIVEAKPEGQTGECITFHGAGHGFGLRADLVIEQAEKQANDAEDQAIAWFNRHFCNQLGARGRCIIAFIF